MKTGETQAVLSPGTDNPTSLKMVSLNLSEIMASSDWTEKETCPAMRLGQGMVRMGTRAEPGPESDLPSEDQ